jgi:hypothetical protein
MLQLGIKPEGMDDCSAGRAERQQPTGDHIVATKHSLQIIRRQRAEVQPINATIRKNKRKRVHHGVVCGRIWPTRTHEISQLEKDTVTAKSLRTEAALHVPVHAGATILDTISAQTAANLIDEMARRLVARGVVLAHIRLNRKQATPLHAGNDGANLHRGQTAAERDDGLWTPPPF